MKHLIQTLVVMAICFYAQSIFAEVSKWNGTSSDTSWYNETATEFHLYTAAQLKGLADIVNDGTSDFSGKTVYLENDIDLSEYQWTPIGYGLAVDRPFRGVFDGQNHIVQKMYIDNNQLNNFPSRYVGFIGHLNNGAVKSLDLEGAIDINKGYSQTAYIGGVVAWASGESVIKSIRSSVVIKFFQSGGSLYVGNVAGHAHNISQVRSEGEVHFYNYNDINNGYYGGIVGSANEINECFSNVSVVIPGVYAGNSYIGGIAGAASSIFNAIFTGRFEVYDTNTANTTRRSGCISANANSLNCIVSAPSYYICSTSKTFLKGLVVPSISNTAGQDVYYTNTYNSGGSEIGTSTSEDYLKSGIPLSGFDTSIWEFTEGRLPRLKSLIPDYYIYTPTERGSIAYCVKEGGEAKVKISTNQEWEIDKIYVNQIDVTNQMIGNILFLHDINENKELFVVYKQTPSNIGSIKKDESFNIARASDGILISGVLPGKSISVYDLNGMVLMRQISNGNNHFFLPKGLYIITANGQSRKISF